MNSVIFYQREDRSKKMHFPHTINDPQKVKLLEDRLTKQLNDKFPDKWALEDAKFLN